MTLVGRIGADPIVKQTKTGKDFLIYKVATSDPYFKPAEGSESSFSSPFLPSSFPTPRVSLACWRGTASAKDEEITNATRQDQALIGPRFSSRLRRPRR